VQTNHVVEWYMEFRICLEGEASLRLRMATTEWTCPYCNRPQVVTDENSTHVRQYLAVGYKGKQKSGDPYLLAHAIRCLNPGCGQMSLDARLVLGTAYTGGTFEERRKLKEWRLLPASYSKPQPPYIPEPLRDDYNEACSIRDLSPKASATLSRRCLQGMIRDFAGISRARLVDEIKALRKSVDEGNAPQGVSHDSIDAIDNVRNIGNIGAHMEADINHIVDVDPGEAQLLIELIESLFDEWYVARRKREERFAALAAIAAEKKELQEQKPAALDGPSMSLSALGASPETET
jgi:hypothetical protein